MTNVQTYDTFEYMLLPFSGYSATHIINELNNLGKKGWELTNIQLQDGSLNKYILKRKIIATQL